MIRRGIVAAGVVAISIVAGGCGGSDAPSTTEAAAKDADTAASAPVDGVLVVRGRAVDAAGRAVGAEPAAASPRASRPQLPLAPRRIERRAGPWPAPPLLPDGTIDAGTDPFGDGAVPVQPVPIEDDPGSTALLGVEAMQLRRIDVERWQQWREAEVRSPWQQAVDPTTAAVVQVAVERCGGARTVATGVVLDDETVVTTVHAIESPASRVRVMPVSGGRRLPAMVRYLDVDDDVAVLKVPGLSARPMDFHVPVDQQPRLGYAYGIVAGGRSGMLRRAPVLTSMREATIDVEQPDGFARRISGRPVQTVVGSIAGGFSGGVVSATNDPLLRGGFGFHGLVRARVPFRATAGVVVPSSVVGAALDAAERLEEWFEHPPGGCPQWRRPPRALS